MQFESLPEKRDVPAFVKKASAQSVVLELMKTGVAEREASNQKLEREQKRADDLAVALALQIYRKRASDDTFVRALTALLADMQVQLFTYAGEALTTELESGADIIEWLPAEENETECVAEAIEPEIRWQGRILHRAKLSCRKAPERADEVLPALTETEPSAPAAAPAQEPPEHSGDTGTDPALVASEPEPQLEETEKASLFNRVGAWIRRRFASRKQPQTPQQPEFQASNETNDQNNEQEGSKTE